ncbi:MAG: DUF5908 family protein [Saprospiraceae bacterium]|nr:hypothetical protein [Lewinellaceae bacterium]
MPIEILELVIKAQVGPSESNGQNDANPGQNQPDRSALKPVEKSVRAIMDILKRKNER